MYILLAVHLKRELSSHTQRRSSFIAQFCQTLNIKAFSENTQAESLPKTRCSSHGDPFYRLAEKMIAEQRSQPLCATSTVFEVNFERNSNT